MPGCATTRYTRASGAEFIRALLQALLPLATPAIIVGGIVGGLFTPTEASVVAVTYALFLGAVVYRTVGLRELPKVLYESARFAAISLFCIGTASAFGWLLAYFHIPQVFVDWVPGWGDGPISVGFIVMIACALGKITIREALKDVLILLVPMLGVLVFVILFPDVILALPWWLMPNLVK
jgi:TRAP-type C4-dicarboxylate transport system permease large subunit